MLRLYQFAGSHYCEKARWALDYKGLDYKVVNLVPGPHRRSARKLAPGTGLPILQDEDTIVQGSAAIIDYLDKQQARPPLTPTSTQDASMAHEWERYLDANIGVNVRLLFYFYAFKQRRLASEFLLRDAPWWGRPFFAFAYGPIKRAMTEAMSINEASAARAKQQLAHAFDRIDERIEGKQFLVGARFSRADLTASALLFHRWRDDWPAPAPLESMFQELSERPYYRWASSIYMNYRQRETAVE